MARTKSNGSKTTRTPKEELKNGLPVNPAEASPAVSSASTVATPPSGLSATAVPSAPRTSSPSVSSAPVSSAPVSKAPAVTGAPASSAATTSAPEPKTASEPRKLEVVRHEPRKNVLPINLEEEIRRRAYELYQQRGSSNGNEADDWYRAEREVRQRYQQQASAQSA